MVFALWPYILTHAKLAEDSNVELNPGMLGAIFGESAEKVSEAIDYLCREDPNSRNSAEGGRRMIRRGPFRYHVVNLRHWRNYSDNRIEGWKRYRLKQHLTGKDVSADHAYPANGPEPSAKTRCSAQSSDGWKPPTPPRQVPGMAETNQEPPIDIDRGGATQRPVEK